MKSNPIKLVSTLLLIIQSVHAATHAVLPGESIQVKVDLAQPGDIVAISSGAYADDVTVNKAIRLVEMDGHEVTITGNVIFTGVTNAPPFEGFTVGSPGKGLTITGTTGLTVRNVDTRPGFGIKVNGASRIAVVAGTNSKIEQDGGELTTTSTAITGTFIATSNAVKTVALKTTVAGDVNWDSKKAWFGYSTARHFKSAGNNSTVYVIGCVIDGGNEPIYQNIGVYLSGSGNKLVVANSIIKGMAYGWVNDGPYIILDSNAWGLLVQGNQQAVDVYNNYFQLYTAWLSGHVWQSQVNDPGIEVSGANCRLYNNIIDGAWRGIVAPFGADVRNNLYSGINGAAESGGLVSSGSISSNPLFISGQAPTLQPTSPCINSGLSDPIFNDLDGTRNDIGPSGGCLFDPQAWTTNKPVVISFDLAPQQLLRGVDTQVNLSKGLGVSQP